MPFISVIIPVYNRAFIIKECIDAILIQSFEDFELILVNDGSTDETLSIIESFSDTRIKCISQKNAGVSSARNKGLEFAVGSWVCFIDSDDVIKPDYLISFVQQGIEKSSQASLYIQNIRVIRNQTHIDTDQELWLQYYKQPFGIQMSFSDYLEHIDITRVAHPFPKLFNRNLIVEHKLVFNTQYHNAEDALFLVEYLAFSKGKIYCIDVKEYYYQKNDNDSLALSNAQNKGSVDGKLLIQVFVDIFLISNPMAQSKKAKIELIRSIQSRLTDAVIYAFKFGYAGNNTQQRISFLKELTNQKDLMPLFQKLYAVDYKSKKSRFLEFLLIKRYFTLFESLFQLWRM